VRARHLTSARGISATQTGRTRRAHRWRRLTEEPTPSCSRMTAGRQTHPLYSPARAAESGGGGPHRVSISTHCVCSSPATAASSAFHVFRASAVSTAVSAAKPRSPKREAPRLSRDAAGSTNSRDLRCLVGDAAADAIRSTTRTRNRLPRRDLRRLSKWLAALEISATVKRPHMADR
jgi:hypothetical protein